MLGILFFVISFFLVFSSSYFLMSIFREKKLVNSLIIFSMIFLSQIIVSMEALSLMKQINPVCTLGINIIIFIFALGIFKYNKSPRIDFRDFSIAIKELMSAFKQDKVLIVLLVFFILSSLISLFLAGFIPTNSGDALTYHLARVGFWLQHGTLAHYETSAIRQIVFPVNSEILILWPMIFLRHDYLATINEYIAYCGCLMVLYGFLKYLKFSTRRTLWAIFILASLPAVIIESSSAQINLIWHFFYSAPYIYIYMELKKKITSQYSFQP